VDADDPGLSVSAQCELLGLSRSSYYYEPARESEANLALMRRIDAQYLETPFFGSRRMALELSSPEEPINRKRVQRLMQIMGIEAIYPRPRTSQACAQHAVYPYLLRNMKIDRADQVWCADITYLPLARGFMYLAAVMDWHSRYVLSWRVSNSLDTAFCVEALQAALGRGRPEIFNTDQGSQFTSQAFTSVLQASRIAISMDGRGRALDNVFIERLWRSVKYEEVYLKEYASVADLIEGLERYFDFYDYRRKHQALANRTPHEAYQASLAQRGKRKGRRSDSTSAALS
jgi:putative transposase